jgi:outer membrane protein OmpA-like peptidoglycan-associated protein
MDITLFTIGEAGVAVVSLFGGFLRRIAPPEGGHAKGWTFFASLLAGLAFLSVKLLAKLPAALPLAASIVGAILILLLGVVLSWVYWESFNEKTIVYGPPNRVIVGNDYTPEARGFLAEHQGWPRGEVLAAFQGRVGDVWTAESLRRARRTLALEYAIAVGCLAFGLYFAIDIANRPSETKPPKHEPALREQLASVKDIHFDLNRTELAPDANERLLDDATILVSLLSRSRDMTLLVEGYCDAQGSTEYNLLLGYQRAEAVRNALIQAGLPADKIQVVSHGKGSFLCSESSEPCRKRNRRVHLTMVE